VAGCLAEDTVLEFLGGKLSSEDVAKIDEHLESCRTCRSLLIAASKKSDATGETLPAAGTDPALSPTVDGRPHGVVKREPEKLGRGASVGRYMIVDVLGAGGMGVVYAAFDPELDRRVALKLLRTDVAEAGGDDAATRLKREARAIAKLAHPNVVSVFDVGSHDGAVFIAMELVDGRSLDTWIHEQPRPWREVVEVFLQAGAGLVAAHEVGMVHRDFKPANVLLGKDGRVRVTDFGLAQLGALESSGRASDPDRMQALADRLTRTGSLVGTPAYMSPEQIDARPLDARTDQFSFAVALYEALYGERPFDGRTVLEIFGNVTEGNVRPDRDAAGVPSWLRTAVVRGLAAEPSNRYPTLSALLAELKNDPALRRRRKVIAGVAGVAVAGAVTLGFVVGTGSSGGAVCDRADAAIDSVWNGTTKQSLLAAVTKAGVNVATAEKIASALDTYRDRWSGMRGSACKAYRIENTRSADVFDAQMRCLDGRLESMRTVIGAISTKLDAKSIDKALDATVALPSLMDCDAQLVTPNAEARRPDVQRAELLLDQADALDDLGRGDEALALIDKVSTTLEKPAPATEAHASCLRASVVEVQSKYDEALRAFERCAELAARAGDDRFLASASLGAIGVQGFRLGRAQEALARVPMAEAAITRIGRPTYHVARFHQIRALVRERAGDLVAAREDYNEALRLFTNIGDLRSASTTLNGLAAVDFEEDKNKDALAHLEQAEKLAVQLYGPTHPKVLTVGNNIAMVLDELGQTDESLKRQEAALARTEKLLGNHYLTAVAAHNLAETYERVGNLTRALELQQRGLAVRISVFGEKQVDTANSYEMLAGTELTMREFDKAIAHVSKSLEIKRAILPAKHPELTSALYELARIYFSRGKLELAFPLVKEVLAIREAETPQNRGRVLTALSGYASVAIDLEKWDEGCPAADRARALQIEVSGPDSPKLSTLEIALAKCAGHAGKWDEAEERIDRAIKLSSGGQTPNPAFIAESELDGSRLLRKHKPRWPRAKALELSAEKRLQSIGDDGKPMLEQLAEDRKKNPRPWK
jgi:tetratricopeptide (TPR) repeat protein